MGFRALPPLATVLLLAALLGGATAAADVYEIIQAHDLPRGVLPQGATAYTLGEDGAFSVTLASQCDVKAGSRTVRYDPTVTGVIGSGTIDKLQGVHVYMLLRWIPIDGVARDGDHLVFRAGPAKESFPASTFASSPACM